VDGKKAPMNLDERCQQIELLLADVDGVLTDGRVVLDNQGIETKQFHVHDGMGIHLWHKAGYRFGVITHRSSHVLKMRAAELGIEIVRQGTDDKRGTMEEILTQLGLTLKQVCYIGDDLPDLPAVRAAGLGVAVADAAAELREAADYLTTATAGNGAVRETIEFILKAQRRWDDLIQPYLT
jgi:3-deoxy-D-manno-octulosonate 8-phosphate phosphatase (KDO 8-P phosphatase)